MRLLTLPAGPSKHLQGEQTDRQTERRTAKAQKGLLFQTNAPELIFACIVAQCGTLL